MSIDLLHIWAPLSVAAWAVHMAVFHGLGLAFEWCDATRKLSRFKVRDVDRLSYRRLLPRVLFNQTAILLPCMAAMEYSGLAFVGDPQTSPLRFVIALVAMGVGHDVVQYVTHRYVLHDPVRMRTLGHALHHTTGASKAISACYQSAADFFFEIVLPYLLPLAVIGGGGANVFFHLLVPCLGAVGGLYEHSGYDFSLAFRDPAATGWRRVDAILAALTSSIAHGKHHTRGDVSFSDGFGSFGICDTVFKTRWDLVPERVRRGDRAKVSASS